MMTSKQKALYWREWARVRAIRPDADRHDLHRRAFDGEDKSSKEFDNADLDKVLAEFRAVTQPANATAQFLALDQPKKRLRVAIKDKLQLLSALGIAMPCFYAAKACAQSSPSEIQWFKDLIATRNAERMYPTAMDLQRVHWTLTRAISRLRQQKEWTEHELYARALRLDLCRCADCKRSPRTRVGSSVTLARSKRQTQKQTAEASGADCPF